MSLPQPAPSASPRSTRRPSKFELQVYVRVVETPLARNLPPEPRTNWLLAIGVAIGSILVALLGGYGLMLLHHAIE